MLSKLKKVLPLNISVNLVLMNKMKIDNVLIESYKYNKEQKKYIFGFLNSIDTLYFKNLNPSEQTIFDDKKMLKNMLRNNITFYVSKDKKNLLIEKINKVKVNNKRKRRKNNETENNMNELSNTLNEMNNNKLSYLIKFIVFNETDNDMKNGKIMKELIVDKIDESLLLELKKYYKSLENINRNKLKVEMTIEYVKKKVERDGVFKINKFLL